MVEMLPPGRFAQGRETLLQRRVQLQSLGHLRLPSFFDGSQHLPAFSRERRITPLGDDRLIKVSEYRRIEVAERLPAGAGLGRLPAEGRSQLRRQEVALIAIHVQTAYPDQADF